MASLSPTGRFASRCEGGGGGGQVKQGNRPFFQKYYNTLCFPSKICISIDFNFSCDLQSLQEKLKTILMKNFEYIWYFWKRPIVE